MKQRVSDTNGFSRESARKTVQYIVEVCSGVADLALLPQTKHSLLSMQLTHVLT